VTADALTLAVGVSLTGLLRPLLGCRRTTGVLVCEVDGRNVGLELAVGVIVVVVLACWLNEGDGRGGAGDLVLDPVEVVDRKDAELGVFRSVGLVPVLVVDPVELYVCTRPGLALVLGVGSFETSTLARTRGRWLAVEAEEEGVVTGEEMVICPVTYLLANQH
jgi:hypothetical protein